MVARNASQIHASERVNVEPIGSEGVQAASGATSGEVRIARPLIVAGAIVTGAGLAVELVHTRSHAPAVETLVDLCSLSYEANVPTWYSSSLLLGCALVLGAIARDVDARRGPRRAHWLVLAIGFLSMSLDEAVELHEQLGGLFGTHGVLYFDWVIPAAAVVAIVGAAFLPFLRDLPPRRRRWFVAAGAIYLGGAVGMELPLGWWTEHHGAENAGYALIDWAEEALEILGVSVFLVALVERWHHRAEARP